MKTTIDPSLKQVRAAKEQVRRTVGDVPLDDFLARVRAHVAKAWRGKNVHYVDQPDRKSRFAILSVAESRAKYGKK